MDCIFCKIIDKQIPSSAVYEDENVYAFKDINPQAPVHVLIVPKKHVSSADEVSTSNSDCIARIFEAIPVIAKSLGLENGYRIITNVGEDGCQSVKHIHFHLLGGKKLPEKMS